MSVKVRPKGTTGWDAVAGCNSCPAPAVAIIEFDFGGGTNVVRVCADCGHSLSTQLQELNL